MKFPNCILCVLVVRRFQQEHPGIDVTQPSEEAASTGTRGVESTFVKAHMNLFLPGLSKTERVSARHTYCSVPVSYLRALCACSGRGYAMPCMLTKWAPC